MDVRIYTDGGSRGNPGPAASGAVIKELKNGKEGALIATVSKFLGVDTNNQAEYTAMIISLQKAHKLGAKRVEMYLDSELAMRQLNGQYKVRDAGIAKRFLEVKNLLTNFDRVTFTHVRREKNKEADAIVNKVLDEHA
jgi:ribonuclease HI